MAQRVDSKPYVLDRLFEIAEVLHDVNAEFDRKIPIDRYHEVLDNVMQLTDKATAMLEQVLENPWWGGRITHDRSEDPIAKAYDEKMAAWRKAEGLDDLEDDDNN